MIQRNLLKASKSSNVYTEPLAQTNQTCSANVKCARQTQHFCLANRWGLPVTFVLSNYYFLQIIISQDGPKSTYQNSPGNTYQSVSGKSCAQMLIKSSLHDLNSAKGRGDQDKHRDQLVSFFTWSSKYTNGCRPVKRRAEHTRRIRSPILHPNRPIHY